MLDTPFAIDEEHCYILEKWFEGADEYVVLAGFGISEENKDFNTVYIVGRYTENYKIDKIILSSLIEIPDEYRFEISIDDEFEVNNIDKKDALEISNRILRVVFKRAKRRDV